MIVRLFCPVCAYEATKRGNPTLIDTFMPVTEVRDDGCYEITCDAGHATRVALKNVKFEVLFELALNGLMDGYQREAVSSFTSSLELFFEFFWRVACTHFGIPSEEATEAWKSVASQSERQLGMFITAHLLLTKRAPKLLTNTEVHFRNRVIHKGVVPSRGAAAKYGDAVQGLINAGLSELRVLARDAVESTYDAMVPSLVERTPDEIVGGINIVTPVDVKNPVTKENDLRRGGVLDQFQRLKQERLPHKLSLLTKEELKKRAPDVYKERYPEEG